MYVQRIISNLSQDSSSQEKDKNGGNEEFDVQRDDAIKVCFFVQNEYTRNKLP